MALWKWAIGLQSMQRTWWQTLVKQYTGLTYYNCRFSPTTSWLNNICSNKEKCHTLVLYPAINLWSALEYSVYCTIIRIFQSFAACFLLTEYSFQFQVWLIAYLLSHQIASRCHGKGVACRCSIWYAACKSLVWHCCPHYWASQTKSRFRTGELENWHYGNQLGSTSWKIESTDLKHFRTS